MIRIPKKIAARSPNSQQLQDQLNQLLAEVKPRLEKSLVDLIKKYPDVVLEAYDAEPCFGVAKDLVIAALMEEIHQYRAPGSQLQIKGSRHAPASIRSAKRIWNFFVKIGPFA